MIVLFVKPRSACGVSATTAFLKYLQRAEKTWRDDVTVKINYVKKVTPFLIVEQDCIWTSNLWINGSMLFITRTRLGLTLPHYKQLKPRHQSLSMERDGPPQESHHSYVIQLFYATVKHLRRWTSCTDNSRTAWYNPDAWLIRTRWHHSFLTLPNLLINLVFKCIFFPKLFWWIFWVKKYWDTKETLHRNNTYMLVYWIARFRVLQYIILCRINVAGFKVRSSVEWEQHAVQMDL